MQAFTALGVTVVFFLKHLNAGISTSGNGVRLGNVPPAEAISWLNTITSSESTTALVTNTLSSTSATGDLTQQGTTPAVISAHAIVPAGAYMEGGLLPVPEKLVTKITNLEFVEMRELMPETWLREEEDSKLMAWPRRRPAPVTDILQWLSCYAVMVGVLSRVYPTMVPEFMAYQTTIIRCYRDFEGLAWAQYDRAFRRQVAQTKDLHWSRLNTTPYSLCFAGKAKCHIACNFCLSDNHSSESCPENPARSTFLWQQMFGTLYEPRGFASSRTPVPRARNPTPICHLFNARDGPWCKFNPCKFAHICIACKGAHPKSACRASNRSGTDGETRFNYKRPRVDSGLSASTGAV